MSMEMANKQFSNVFLPLNCNMRSIFMGHYTRAINIRGANTDSNEQPTFGQANLSSQRITFSSHYY